MTSNCTISERPNIITENIDLADCETFISLLSKVDQQLFNGYDDYDSSLSDGVIRKLSAVASQLHQVLAQNGVVAMAGAGTSGRLAHMLCRHGNDMLLSRSLPGHFEPLVAGGLAALISAQEGAEDSPILASNDLQNLLDQYPSVPMLYIGITCGLSAPYVGAQVHKCLSLPNVFPVVVGFSPVQLARAAPIPNWETTFKEVLKEMVEKGGIALTPVVGPGSNYGKYKNEGWNCHSFLNWSYT
ncbi:hypothetical protein GEMRC1_004061 [Eukaryota sp. GEM-RC1]